MKNYETEVRSRWGDTDAYRENEQKTKNYTNENHSQYANNPVNITNINRTHSIY